MIDRHRKPGDLCRQGFCWHGSPPGSSADPRLPGRVALNLSRSACRQGFGLVLTFAYDRDCLTRVNCGEVAPCQHASSACQLGEGPLLCHVMLMSQEIRVPRIRAQLQCNPEDSSRKASHPTIGGCDPRHAPCPARDRQAAGSCRVRLVWRKSCQFRCRTNNCCCGPSLTGR